MKLYSRDIPAKYEGGLDLAPLRGAMVTSCTFVPWEYVRFTFDTGDVVTIYEEGQAGEISVDMGNWMVKLIPEE